MTWNPSDIRRARQTPLAPILEKLGYELVPATNGNYKILGLPKAIVIKEHYWICAEDGSSGNAIDFLVNIQGLPFTEAMRLLLS